MSKQSRDGGIPQPGPAPFTLAYYAQENPTKQALSDGQRTYTFREFYLLANRMANVLADAGVGRGDRVAVLMHNCIEAIAISYGVGKLKANVVPIGYRLKSKEIAYIINNSRSMALVMGAEFDEEVHPVIGNLESVATDRILVSGGKLPWAAPLDDLIESASDTDPEVDPEESSSSIIYTSGTTGLPKGAFRDNRPRDLELIMRQVLLCQAAQGPLQHVLAVEGADLNAQFHGPFAPAIRRAVPLGAVADVSSAAAWRTRGPGGCAAA